jgi:hypothetical protein
MGSEAYRTKGGTHVTSSSISKLSEIQIRAIRRRWLKDITFLGFPDAERDAKQSDWYEHLLVTPDWFKPATNDKATLIVGRKGAGKSAAKEAAMRQRQIAAKAICIEISADELASAHASRLKEASDRGFGAVADWVRIFADLIIRHVAQQVGGKLVVGGDEMATRAWETTEGITERDFGERLATATRTIIPWARKVSSEMPGRKDVGDAPLQLIAKGTHFALYVDDFDNLQENANSSAIRLIRDAVEAADRITHHNTSAEVHLLMRQDLWLRLRPGWHYADKVTGVVDLNWAQDDLRKWAERRLRQAAAIALNVEHTAIRVSFDELWRIFFPDTMKLRDGTESSSFHYMVRRTMYTPRSLRRFMELAMTGVDAYPLTATDIENGEHQFSSDQAEFLKTEFGDLCNGLDICLQSFTGKPQEWIASDLYKHLRGLIGNGQVKLKGDLSDFDPDVSLARFLYRIGFLEVRYPQHDRFEVRDVMRYPEHWKSIRKDDAIRWAVRSAFFLALRSHR